MVQGGISCVKYCMFGFNFIFVICGIILIVIGGIATTTDVTMFLDSKYFTVPVILIILGVIIFLLSFLGCCGAAKENRCMIITFGVLLFIIFIVEIGAGIAGYMYQNEIQGFVKQNLNDSISQNATDARVFWDETQSEAKCCGVDGPNDYTSRGREIPKSCCEPDQEGECIQTKAFQKGCYDTILKKIKDNIALVAGVGIGIAVVELLGVLFSFCLASAIKKEYEGV